VSRFRSAALKLLPPGAGITTAVGSAVYELLEALSLEPGRLQERANDLLSEAVPTSAYELLRDWEEVFGLPDDCVQPESLEDRRTVLQARIRGLGGHTEGDYDSVAEGLGLAIDEYRRYPIARCTSPCDSRIRSEEWANVVEVRPLDVAESTAPQTRLECEFNRRIRSHSLFIFKWLSANTHVVTDEDGVALLDEAGNYIIDEGG
jgi:uncharacterized protein YmfQ (DUF2313 family)